MERLIKYLSSLWLKFDDSRDYLFDEVLLKSRTSTILFLLFIMTVFNVLMTITFPFNSKSESLLFIIGFLIIGFVTLLLGAAYLDKEKEKKLRLYPIDFNKLNYNSINYSLLRFDDEEKLNFILLTNRGRVRNKINFKEKNRSKESASHPKLFSMFHVLLKGGIESIADKRKDIFFDMMKDSFLMNGKEINPKTLKSSFSTWKGKITDTTIVEYIQFYQEIFQLKEKS
ncbi:MAG: hypothetical protein AAGC64_01115 [Bacteroidota bacterium]